MAVDYLFYATTYGGRVIDQNDWCYLEKRAAEQLARYKRIYTVTAPDENAESMAICAMAEAMQSFDLILSGEGGPVSSATIGSVSVSYGKAGSGVDVSETGRARELYRCACLYLDIYRGVS